MFEQTSRRADLALYAWPKALEAIFKFFKRRNLVPLLPQNEKALTNRALPYMICAVGLGVLGIGSIERKGVVDGKYKTLMKEIWE